MKKKKRIYLNGLGIKQLGLLQRMFKEELVIRVINDHDKRDIELQDEAGDNTYETVSWAMLNALGRRNLFSYSGWMPALFVTIDTFRVKKEVFDLLGWKKPNRIVGVQECDTTEADSNSEAKYIK